MAQAHGASPDTYSASEACMLLQSCWASFIIDLTGGLATSGPAMDAAMATVTWQPRVIIGALIICPMYKEAL